MKTARPTGLWENYKRFLIETYSPDADSPVGRLIAQADALEAERETFQNPHTTAADQVLKLERAVSRPQPVSASRPHSEQVQFERDLADLEVAKAKKGELAQKIGERTAKIREIQNKIADMLLSSTVDDSARERELEKVLRA